MRVVCNTIEDFVENLKIEGGNHVFQKVVYVTMSKRPLGSDSKRTAVVFAVNFQASTVVDLGEGQYILDFGEDCGMDYMDGDKELNGTDQATRMRGQLQECCESLGLSIRPGIVQQ
ncbi:hypothetical protein M0R72_14205 [Candidatus Pacearchaeota archaeon]|jgi:hypothetical protein|nr:hypothetical protein [Candidatus Pacearchaeota archaeon]